MKHYSDWFEPKKSYKPVMTREAINEAPDTWLSFYPHPSFTKILRALLTKLDSGDRSIWMTGTYGSGKSHAALVLRKLFMDEDGRVQAYLKDNSSLIPAEVATALLDARKRGTLAVYDTGSDDVRAPQQLIWRIERAVLAAAKDAGWTVPAITGAEELLQRVERDSTVFFEIRDSMQGELVHLTPDISDAKTLRERVEKKGGELSAGLLQDAERVLERDNVFLSTSAEKFLDWVKALREANGGGKVVFLWDEFSSYIDHAKGDLKTFEELAEAKAQQCGFLFVPITHMALDAFLAAGSTNAKKAETRYESMRIEIQPGQVFHLAEKAFTIKNPQEWADVRDNQLWSEVHQMVTTYMMPRLGEETVDAPEDFKCVLPLHPMSAILLKQLSEKVGQNVRSFFDYLRKTGEESEFERFLAEGGPEVQGRQLLSADYLWRYFVEAESVSPDPAVLEIGADFHSKKKAFRWEDGCAEERVYKAALLYTLLDRKMAGGGSDLTAPTVDNLVRAFQGDGAVANVKGVVETLEKERHCFAVVNGHIQRFQLGDDKGIEDEKEQWREKFSLVTTPTEAELQKIVNDYGDSQRYVVRAFDVATFKKSSLSKLGDFGEGTPKGGNKVAVVALFAKDHAGKLLLAERAQQTAKMFAGLRVCVVYPEELSFCDKRESRWEDFVTLKARYERAGDETTRGTFDKQMRDEIQDWFKSVRAPETAIALVVPDDAGGEPYVISGLSWKTFKAELLKAKARWMPQSPDDFAQGFRNVLDAKLIAAGKWAEAGLTGVATAQYQGIVQRFKGQHIDWTDAWTAENPNHPLALMREFFEKKIKNAIGKGTPCSVRKAYLELQRAPWGLEKNAYSAFVLGFALRPWLDKGLQWTDGVNAEPLDVATLAEIIAKVVENDGAGEIKNEKQVCKLSKEEKLFVKHVANLFDLRVDSSATPLEILNRLGISGAINQRTGGVPLWMLPDYIRQLGTETAEDAVCGVIEDLCEAVVASSAKNNKDGSRLERVKAIGTALDPEKNPGLAETVGSYLEPGTFAKAFDLWLEKAAPEAKALAKEAGDDKGIRLRKDIEGRFVQETNWIWKERDLSDALADIEARLRFLREYRALHGPFGGWVEYDEARNAVRKAVFEDNRIPIVLLSHQYPFAGKLAELLKNDNPTAADINETARILKDEAEGYRSLFRNAEHKAALACLESLFSDSGVKVLTADDWRGVYNDIPKGGSGLDEEGFRKTAGAIVQKRVDTSFRGKLAAAWKAATSSESPEGWSEGKTRPAEIVFASRAAADTFFGVWKNPSAATTEERKAALATLSTLKMPTDSEADARFLARYLPDEGLATMGIPAEALAEWFRDGLGEPNGWRWHPDLEKVRREFVHGSYQKDILPKAKAKVDGMDGAEAKARLRDLVEKLPEAGLALLE